MRRGRCIAAVVATVLAGGGALVAPTAAGADGTTNVPATCTNIPVVGSLSTSVDITANDTVDPVTVGGKTNLVISVPVPVGDVPISATITEVKFFAPIPADVTIDGVTFTSSSFPTKAWAVSGGNLVVTLSGSVSIGGGSPAPTMPDVTVKTTVGGAARTISWKVPSTITAKGNAGIFGNFTANCTPNNSATVLATTTVGAGNRAPVAVDQTLPVGFETATPVQLSATDPDGDAITYAIGTPPAHGTLTGTAPALTYTPAAGYAGADSFTFTASDGALSDTGTVTVDVSALPDTVPGAPAITGATVVGEGAATVSWTAPASDGGQPVTDYQIRALQSGVETTLATVGASTLSYTATDLKNGVPATLKVAAINTVGTGPAASATPVTAQWWLPWTSSSKAVDELFTWMTGKAPTATERSNWLAQLDAGFKKPADLVAYLRTLADATTNVDPTVRLYSAYLTRIPDAGGLNFWLGRRRSGWTLSRISSNFAASSEFIRRYGSMTNRQFVENIYANVLERAGDSAGITYWTGQLDAKKKSRGQVMINFSESNEYKNKQGRNVAAAVVYIHVLGKTPTTAQRAAFIAALDTDGLVPTVRTLLREPSFADRAG